MEPRSACYHDDAFDLYAADQPLLARFPGLVALAPDAEVRPNLLEWVVRDPAAKKVIGNWEERAIAMANAFLVVAPGRIPERRIQHGSCRQCFGNWTRPRQRACVTQATR
ncbi:hypothetical protein [Nocardia sp. NPDC047038]|uniref:hypothetical protein n=1 Tax=Nocardia sp. NPDC047038 TaxID=3154338 RepID=UPI0033E00640